MIHDRLFLIAALFIFFMGVPSFGHASSLDEINFNLNNEVEALLDRKSSGECFSRVYELSVHEEETHKFLISPVPETKPKPPLKWVRVICQDDITPNFLYWLEVRLVHVGVLEEQNIYENGMKVNLDKRLYKAIEDFQILYELDLDGMSYETINALSVLDIPNRYRILDIEY